jgi:hypothetical protein
MNLTPGLFVRKRKPTSPEKGIESGPKHSKLGLDELAKRKRSDGNGSHGITTLNWEGELFTLLL